MTKRNLLVMVDFDEVLTMARKCTLKLRVKTVTVNDRSYVTMVMLRCRS